MVFLLWKKCFPLHHRTLQNSKDAKWVTSPNIISILILIFLFGRFPSLVSGSTQPPDLPKNINSILIQDPLFLFFRFVNTTPYTTINYTNRNRNGKKIDSMVSIEIKERWEILVSELIFKLVKFLYTSLMRAVKKHKNEDQWIKNSPYCLKG